MRLVGTFEAKNKLSELLDEVAEGRDVLITRHGKPVARLTAPAVPDRSSARAAVKRILSRREGKTLGGVKIKMLIDEGRP